MKALWMGLVGLILLVGVASAEKPVVIVTGDDAAVVEAVEKAMRGKVKIVGEGERDRAAAVVEVTVTPTGKAARKAKKLTATVVVTQVADGAELGKLVVKDRKAKLPRAVGKQTWKKLGKAIGRAKGRVRADEPVAVAPAEPVEPPRDREVEEALVTPGSSTSTSPSTLPSSSTTTTTTTSTSTSVAASTESGSRVGRVVIGVSERPFYRRLRWNDDLDDVLRRYDLAANAVGVTVGVRPLKGVDGLWVGVDGELVVGVNGSRTDDGMSYGTSGSEVSAGVRYGLSIAGSEVAVGVAYGEQRFAIDDEQMTQELVPDVTYRYARGGVDVGVPMGKWTLMVRGGWRQLLGVGELKDWFPRQTGNGLDASVGMGLRVTRWLSAYARADLRHYFFTMNPEPGDELVAGGAVDSFVGGAIGLAVTIR